MSMIHPPRALGRALALSAGLICCVTPQLASAQGVDMEAAKQRFLAGRAAFDAKNYLEAAEAFYDAYELSKRAELFYNIGQAYRLAGRPLQAQQLYQRYLKELPNAPNADEVRKTVEELDGDIKRTRGLFDISTKVAGRQVFVDDEKRARCAATPCTIALTPGKHTLSVRGEGVKPVSKAVVSGVGGKKSLSFDLTKPPEGMLLVSTDLSGAQLKLKDQTLSLPLDKPASLPPGSYPAQIIKDGAIKWSGSVSVSPAETTRLVVPLAQAEAAGSGGGSILRPIGAGVLGLGLGLVISGAIMNQQAGKTYDALKAQEDAGVAIDPALIDQGKSQQGTANLIMILGGVSAAAGGGLLVWDFMKGDTGERAAPSEEQPAAPAKGGVPLLD